VGHEKFYNNKVVVFDDRATLKACDAAISSRQWNKAVQILEVIRDNPKCEMYYKKIADHYANIGEYEKAERYGKESQHIIN
jgi:intraflagellar transport protein 172